MPPLGAHAGGFTLVEMLLVVAIIAILSSVVMLGVVDVGRHTHVRAEAERLARLVELARQQALRDNELWGLVVEEAGYRFQRLDAAQGAWQEVAERPFNARPSEQAVRFAIATNFNEDMRERLLGVTGTEDEESKLPAVVVYPSGELTAFEVTVFLDGAQNVDETAWLTYTDGVQRARARHIADEPEHHPRNPLADLAWDR